MTPLVLIRHGPTAWNSEKRLQGHTDVSLSDAGREIVSRWQIPPPIDQYHWVSSPLRRATETAELLGAKAPEIESRLKEMNYGTWEGSRLDDLRAALGEGMAENEARGVDFCPEGGEKPREVQERLASWFLDVASRGRPTVAVSHHGVLRAIYSMATGWNMVDPLPEKFRWGTMHFFRITDTGKVSVERINITIAPE